MGVAPGRGSVQNRYIEHCYAAVQGFEYLQQLSDTGMGAGRGADAATVIACASWVGPGSVLGAWDHTPLPAGGTPNPAGVSQEDHPQEPLALRPPWATAGLRTGSFFPTKLAVGCAHRWFKQGRTWLVPGQLLHSQAGAGLMPGSSDVARFQAGRITV